MEFEERKWLKLTVKSLKKLRQIKSILKTSFLLRSEL